MRRTILLAAACALLIVASTATAQDVPINELGDEAVLAMLQDVEPGLYRELVAMDDRDSFQFRRRMNQARGRLQLRTQHPEWAEADELIKGVEAEIDAKIDEYRAAVTDEEQAAIQGELEDLATQFHDLKLDSYRFRLALLTLRMEELEQTIRAREANRDDFIEQWLSHRLEEP